MKKKNDQQIFAVNWQNTELWTGEKTRAQNDWITWADTGTDTDTQQESFDKISKREKKNVIRLKHIFFPF